MGPTNWDIIQIDALIGKQIYQQVNSNKALNGTLILCWQRGKFCLCFLNFDSISLPCTIVNGSKRKMERILDS